MDFAIGDFIWVYPHEELGWAPGEIVQSAGNFYIVQLKDSSDRYYPVRKEDALTAHPPYL